MSPLLLGPVFELGGKIIDRLFPDPAQKAAAELELLKLTQSGDLQTVLAQLEINAKEAQSGSVFVSGARPFIMWICGLGLAYATLMQPALVWLSTIKGWPVPPDVNTDVLMYVLGGLLGLGGLRSMEKVKGVASK
jgi:hypothetical protein